MNDRTERALQLGRLGRTIGLDGGLLFHAVGAAEAELLQPGLTVLADGSRRLVIRERRRHNRGLVLYFEGIRRIEPARELTNADLSVALSSLPAEFTSSDFSSGLLELPVLLSGSEVGRVAEVQGASGHEYLVLEPGGQLVPLNAPYVEVTDTGIVLTDPPDGLL